MQQAIKTITTKSLTVGVNCYLVKADAGYLLIDTGWSGGRGAVERALESAGCKAGNLKLIVLTHGHFDHSANAAYFRETYASQLAMHAADAGMVERGDMFWNAKVGGLNRRVVGILMVLAGEGSFRRFEPDIILEEGNDLAEYGFDSRVIHIPGHSEGSIGLLTSAGDLFCGDLLTNTGRPTVNSLVDDPAAMAASVEKLKSFPIKTVYPGHGRPFPIELLNQG